MRSRVISRAVAGVAAGVAAGGLAIGVSELVAVAFGPASSPFVALGSVVVDHVPRSMKDAAIRAVGSHDKQLLFATLAVGFVIIVAAAGLGERRRRPVGSVIFALIGLAGSAAALTRTNSTILWALPSAIGTIVGIIVLRVFVATWSRNDVPGDPSGDPSGRRRFILIAVGAGVAAVGTAAAGRALQSSVRNVSRLRAAVKLPPPTSRVHIPAADLLDVQGITPFISPNSNFYRVDTALQVPQVDPDSWKLRVHGMVDRELHLSFSDLLGKQLIERPITLTCVSNEVGGKLAGNAKWLGYPIRHVLKSAGVDPDADMVLSSSVDGFSASTPLNALTDSERDAMLVVGMNGEPLPTKHGFPVRMIVPGLYGYVSATKWLTDLEVTRFDRKTAYWTDRGYAAKGPIKMSSRIDVPRSFANLSAGNVAIAGVAWAQHVGIRRVQVQIDDGPWHTAKLGGVPNADTWRQWSYRWHAVPGQHDLRVRCVDANGRVQAKKQADVAPNGSSGWQSRSVQVQ